MAAERAVAKIWMEYVRSGTVADTSTPPAPVNVRVRADANHGNEITWDTEVDMVSGLGGFIVLRDGHGIARLPTQPPESVYGRPLFQGLSFHDTPDRTPSPDGARGYVSQGRRQARLHRDCLEQCGRAFGTLLGGNHSMNEEPQIATP